MNALGWLMGDGALYVFATVGIGLPIVAALVSEWRAR